MQEKQYGQIPQDFNQYWEDRHIKKLEKSDLYNQYKKFFSSFEEYNFDRSQFSSLFCRQLEKHKIKFSLRSFSPFTVNIISNLPNQEIADIELQWGYYKMRATIIKHIGESIFHRCRFSRGSLAKVFKVEDQREPFVVKCVSTKMQNFEDKIKMQKCALRQYFIFRIASALGCGPNMKKSFGFDLLFSENCIQFAMEYCSQIKSMSQKIILQLKESLLTLHQARVVHFDIKPDNLMWSNHFKKEVFVDFGLSEIIDGGPGFKYPVNFKGSLNFCSEEMSELLISQSKQKLLDVYHNDVNCLKETILAFQNIYFLLNLQNSWINSQFSQKSIKYSHEKSNVPIDNYENEKLSLHLRIQIIILKYFIYINSTQDIDQIHKMTAYKDLLFSGQTINFTKNIYSTNKFKLFYHRYITDSIKDSVDYGWIGIWAKSVYAKMAKNQIENLDQKSLFIDISDTVTALSKQNSKGVDNFKKSEIQFILFNKYNGDLQLYFYCFVSYVSFINNYGQIEAEQKIKAIQVFIQLHHPEFAKNKAKTISHSFSENLTELLKEIFLFILLYYAYQQYESHETTLSNVYRLQLMLDIFEHAFFFGMFSTQSTIQLLSKVYFMKLWSQQQRIEIIIRINNDNDWNIVPLFSQISISHTAIQNWIYLRIKDFRKQKINPKVQKMFSMFQFKSCPDDQYLLDYQPFHSFSKSLKIHFWLFRLLHELFDKNKFAVVKVMKFIEDNFPRNQRSRLYSIYFHIFSIFIVHYSNIQQCWSICQLFKSHLRCDKLFNQLIFLRILRMKRQDSAKEKINQLIFMTKVIKHENRGFLMAMLSYQLRNILILTKQITKDRLFNQFRVRNLVQNLMEAKIKFIFEKNLNNS